MAGPEEQERKSVTNITKSFLQPLCLPQQGDWHVPEQSLDTLESIRGHSECLRMGSAGVNKETRWPVRGSDI